MKFSAVKMFYIKNFMLFSVIFLSSNLSGSICSILNSGQVFQKIFFLQSPNYPKEYSDGDDVNWKIIKSDWTVCSVSVIIKDFQLSGTCENSFLKIGDLKLCGRVSQRRITVKLKNNIMDNIKITFKRPSSGHGFNIMVIQHPHTCFGPIVPDTSNCRQELGDDEGLFGVSKYLNGTMKLPMNDCKFVFKKPVNKSYCGVRFRFLSFDLGPNCNSNGILLNGKRYCQQQLTEVERVVPYPSSGSEQLSITVNLMSNKLDGEGFIASYKRIRVNCPVECSHTYRQNVFTITSPNHENQYLENADCEYTIVKNNKNTKCLHMVFDKLDIACPNDYLKLSGDSRKFCNMDQFPNRNYKIPFPVGENQLTIKFHSDKSDTKTGFRVLVRQLESNCPPDVCQAVSGNAVIESPGFPQNYEKSLNCKYIIRRSLDEPMEVTLYKTKFKLGGTSDIITSDGKSLKKIFKDTDTYNLSLLNDIALDFKTSTNSNSGFQLFVNSNVMNLEACPNSNHDKEKDTINTPDYALGNYPENTSCFLEINRYGNNCKVKFTAKTFILTPKDEKTGECLDYIDFGAKHKLCGTITPKDFGTVEIPFGFEKNKIFIMFHSDQTKGSNDKGAVLEYEQSSENCT